MPDPRVEARVRVAGEALAQAASRWVPRVIYREEGQVMSARDGVIAVSGLPGAQSEEVLMVGGDLPALVLGLGPGVVQAAILGEATAVQEGDRVRSTGRLSGLPVGQALVGRVIDPLGQPVDGAPLVGTLQWVPHEQAAPPIHARAAVHQPLYTGTLAIDAMLPLGRGQRELVLGDEGTGRTSLVLTAMLNQRSADVLCVYVAIGRRRAETWQVVGALRASGVRFVVVVAPEDGSAGLRYLAPYAGTSVAEYFRDRGDHVLIVYDDLSAHAVAWRELSLLLGRPPGREAYPGDVFYLHSRLLERATQLSRDLGGGSLTALPVATTEDGRLSAYIPTNLIAITDGQVVLSRSLFAIGQKPAVDVGLSVSRVGGKTQAQAFRRLAGRMRLDYASFLELEAFARVGTRLEASARRRLDLGRRLRCLLRAPRLVPLGIFDELVRLALASCPDALLRIPEDEVERFVTELVPVLREALPLLAGRLEEEAVLRDEDELALLGAVEARVASHWPVQQDAGEDAGEDGKEERQEAEEAHA